MKRHTEGILAHTTQTYHTKPEKKKRIIGRTRTRREHLSLGEIASGKQRTLDEQKECIVCDEIKPETSFVRPCGDVSTACRDCRGVGR